MGNLVRGKSAEDGQSEMQSMQKKFVKKSHNFPFLVDSRTIRHVEGSKVMYIMRGLSGSGKSTIVRLLQETYPDAVVCSADDYFLEDGEYNFDRDKLQQAHEHCQGRAQDACKQGNRPVIIDNTNVRKWEMRYYIDLAAKYNYTVVTVLPKTSWRFKPEILAQRNKHNVPEETLQDKVKIFEKALPLYYGWFANERDSQNLLELGRQCFKECVSKLPQFADLMARILDIQDTTAIKFDKCYDREKSATQTVHCTAFFSKYGKIPSSKEYSTQEVVQKALGKAALLTVIGIVITPRTVGARVRLTPKQLELWGKDDNEGKSPAKKEESSHASAIITDADDSFDQTANNSESGEWQRPKSKSKQKRDKKRDRKKIKNSGNAEVDSFGVDDTTEELGGEGKNEPVTTVNENKQSRSNKRKERKMKAVENKSEARNEEDSEENIGWLSMMGDEEEPVESWEELLDGENESQDKKVSKRDGGGLGMFGLLAIDDESGSNSDQEKEVECHDDRQKKKSERQKKKSDDNKTNKTGITVGMGMFAALAGESEESETEQDDVADDVEDSKVSKQPTHESDGNASTDVQDKSYKNTADAEHAQNKENAETISQSNDILKMLDEDLKSCDTKETENVSDGENIVNKLEISSQSSDAEKIYNTAQISVDASKIEKDAQVSDVVEEIDNCDNNFGIVNKDEINVHVLSNETEKFEGESQSSDTVENTDKDAPRTDRPDKIEESVDSSCVEEDKFESARPSSDVVNETEKAGLTSDTLSSSKGSSEKGSSHLPSEENGSTSPDAKEITDKSPTGNKNVNCDTTDCTVVSGALDTDAKCDNIDKTDVVNEAYTDAVSTVNEIPTVTEEDCDSRSSFKNDTQNDTKCDTIEKTKQQCDMAVPDDKQPESNAELKVTAKTVTEGKETNATQEAKGVEEIDEDEEEEIIESDDEVAESENTPRFQPTTGLGSRAHFTLGYASNWNAVQTGVDLIEVIECEEAMADNNNYVPCDLGAIRWYGQGRCVVYLDTPVTMTTVFSGRY